MIATAVVLAAGRGTRLGSLTESIPKALVEVGGRAVVDHLLDALAGAGIARGVVVTGHRADVLETHLAARSRPHIAFARQPEPRGTADALVRARRQVATGEPVYVCWGDIVTDPGDHAAVMRAWTPDDDAVLGVWRVDDPTAGGAVVFDEGGIVREIVEKPSPGTVPSPWNNAGLMVLGPAIWDELDRLEPSPRGELELPEAITSMATAGRVRAVPLRGPWFDIGTPEGLAAARHAHR